MNQAVDEILQGPEYFDCERLKARMHVGCCVARQKKAKRRELILTSRDWSPSRTHIVFYHCLDCPQGRENMKGGGSMKKGNCKNCARPNMPIIGRDLCPACYRYKDDPEGLKGARLRLGPKKPSPPPPPPAAQPKASPPPFALKAEKSSIDAVEGLLAAFSGIPGLRTTLTITIEK